MRRGFSASPPPAASSSRRPNGVNIENACLNMSMFRRTWSSSSGPNAVAPNAWMNLLTELLLLARERFQRDLEVGRNQLLHESP